MINAHLWLQRFGDIVMQSFKQVDAFKVIQGLKVTDVGTKGNPVYGFLLVIHSDIYPTSRRLGDIEDRKFIVLLR